MPKVRLLQSNFTAGEFSPRLFGRVDLERYPNGAAELMNMVIHPQGGAQRRTGSYWCGAVKTETSRVRLIPFVASNLAAYVLELGDLYMRIWRNRGPVMAGASQLELVTPYPLDTLRQVRFVQSVDVMYFFHETYPTRKLSRVAADQFNLTTAVFRDGPYIPENTGHPTVATGAGSTTSGGTTGGNPTGGSGGNDGGAAGTGGDTGGGDSGGGGDGGDGGGGDSGGDGGGDAGGGAE